MRDDETDAAADGDSTPRAARVKGGRKNKPGPAARAAVGVGFAAAAAFVGAAVGGGGDVMAGGGGAEESICGGNGNGGGARGRLGAEAAAVELHRRLRLPSAPDGRW